MKQSVSLFKDIALVIILTLSFLAFSLFITSCSKEKGAALPDVAFAGQYQVVDDNETYVLQVVSKGGNNFQINEFGGFLNVPLNAVAQGNMLTIPSQTFTNPNGSVITVVGKGVLSTTNSKDDTITFQYSVSGFAEYEGDFTGTRK
jgi:hypothetical protein